jgi:hypothetical protein
MKTIEKINNIDVEIEWRFIEKMDSHDSNWFEWACEGFDKDGNKYQANCQADGTEPYDLHDNVTDVELLKLDSEINKAWLNYRKNNIKHIEPLTALTYYGIFTDAYMIAIKKETL